MDNANIRRSTSRGFSLIELVVVSGILVIITSILLFNNARFGGIVLLENLAYDVALSIRQAQVYGISVYRYGTGTFDVGYGVHFEKSAAPSVYVLFADASSPANGFYDAGETVLSTTVERGYYVADLCVTDNQVETCGYTKLDVTFVRPEPAAYIRVDGGVTIHERARIVLASPRGDRRSVVVEASGQIAVQ